MRGVWGFMVWEFEKKSERRGFIERDGIGPGSACICGNTTGF